jgi:hypothetical protein
MRLVILNDLYQFNKLMRIELVSYILDLKGAPTK